MPTYELSVVLKVMNKPETVATLKRVAGEIFTRGGFLRKIEWLGVKPTPYKISAHGLPHRKGSYFIVEFEAPRTCWSDLHEVYGRDVDIIRKRIFNTVEPESFECTLHDELLPPAYRSEVQKMMELARKKLKPKYNLNIGLDQTVFQK